jgi:hypothetical protein
MVDNPAQVQALLDDIKVDSAAQLRMLLDDPKIDNAAQLQRLLGDPKITDAAQLQDLVGRYQSGQQLETLLAAPEVASGADLIRLANVMDQAGVVGATTGGLPDAALARFAQANVLAELEATAALQNAGRVRGLDRWIRFAADKDPVDLARSVGELTEARRQAAANPGSVIDVGGDANAPRNPATGDPLQSFDMTVEDPAGNVVKSVEVTTVDNPVIGAPDLTPGVRHAADKVASRNAAGVPVPGEHEVSIRMRLDVGRQPVGGLTREIFPNGDVVLTRPDGAVVPNRRSPTGNIFNDVPINLRGVANEALLDHIVLVDPNTGNVVAAFDRTPAGWVRVR